MYVLFISFKLFNLAFKAYRPIGLKKIGLVGICMDSNLERRPVLIADSCAKFALCRALKNVYLYSYQERRRLAFIEILPIFGVYVVHFLEIAEHYYSTEQVFRLWKKAGKANRKKAGFEKAGKANRKVKR